MRLEEKTIKLYEAMLSGKGIQGITNVLHEFLGNPVTVSSSSLETLAYAENAPVDDSYWADLVGSSVEAHFDAEQEAYKLGIAPGRMAVVSNMPKCAYRVMACGAMSGNRTMGYILALESDRPFSEDDRRLVESASSMVAFLLSNSADDADAETKAERELLSLLRGHTPDEHAIRNSDVLPSIDAEYCLLVTDLIENFKQKNVPAHLVDAIRFGLPDSRTLVYHKRIVSLVLLGTPRKPSDEIVPHVEHLMAKRGMLCGISMPAKGHFAIRTAYEQASSALRLGSRLFPAPNTRVHLYRTMMPFDLIDTAATQTDVRRFQDSVFTKLQEYDLDSGGAKWFQTMAVFVLCNGNVKQSADWLCIQKASMQYRLKRISSIIGENVQAPHVISRLHLSLMILYYLDGPSFCLENDIPQELFISSLNGASIQTEE